MTFRPGARLKPKRVRGVRTPFRNLRRAFRRPVSRARRSMGRRFPYKGPWYRS